MMQNVYVMFDWKSARNAKILLCRVDCSSVFLTTACLQLYCVAQRVLLLSEHVVIGRTMCAHLVDMNEINEQRHSTSNTVRQKRL